MKNQPNEFTVNPEAEQDFSKIYEEPMDDDCYL